LNHRDTEDTERTTLCPLCLCGSKAFRRNPADVWPQEAIEAALGADLADAIPELLCLADLEVRIPRLEILALERLADRDGKSVDAVLARELLDVVAANSEYLATAILGFIAALLWPQ